MVSFWFVPKPVRTGDTRTVCGGPQFRRGEGGVKDNLDSKCRAMTDTQSDRISTATSSPPSLSSHVAADGGECWKY